MYIKEHSPCLSTIAFLILLNYFKEFVYFITKLLMLLHYTLTSLIVYTLELSN